MANFIAKASRHIKRAHWRRPSCKPSRVKAYHLHRFHTTTPTTLKSPPAMTEFRRPSYDAMELDPELRSTYQELRDEIGPIQDSPMLCSWPSADYSYESQQFRTLNGMDVTIPPPRVYITGYSYAYREPERVPLPYNAHGGGGPGQIFLASTSPYVTHPGKVPYPPHSVRQNLNNDQPPIQPFSAPYVPPPNPPKSSVPAKTLVVVAPKPRRPNHGMMEMVLEGGHRLPPLTQRLKAHHSIPPAANVTSRRAATSGK